MMPPSVVYLVELLAQDKFGGLAVDYQDIVSGGEGDCLAGGDVATGEVVNLDSSIRWNGAPIYDEVDIVIIKYRAHGSDFGFPCQHGEPIV